MFDALMKREGLGVVTSEAKARSRSWFPVGRDFFLAVYFLLAMASNLLAKKRKAKDKQIV